MNMRVDEQPDGQTDTALVVLKSNHGTASRAPRQEGSEEALYSEGELVEEAPLGGLADESQA